MARLVANTAVVRGLSELPDPGGATSGFESYLKTSAPLNTPEWHKQFDVFAALLFRVTRWRIDFDISQETSQEGDGLEQWSGHIKGWGYTDAALSQAPAVGTPLTIPVHMHEKLLTPAGSGLMGPATPGMIFENPDDPLDSTIEINEWSGQRTGGSDPGAFIGGAYDLFGGHNYGGYFRIINGQETPFAFPIVGNQLAQLRWSCQVRGEIDVFDPPGRYPSQNMEIAPFTADESPLGIYGFVGNATITIPDWIRGSGTVSLTQKLWSLLTPPAGLFEPYTRLVDATLTLTPMRCLLYGENDYARDGKIVAPIWNDDGTATGLPTPLVGTRHA